MAYVLYVFEDSTAQFSALHILQKKKQWACYGRHQQACVLLLFIFTIGPVSQSETIPCLNMGY